MSSDSIEGQHNEIHNIIIYNSIHIATNYNRMVSNLKLTILLNGHQLHPLVEAGNCSTGADN